MFANGIRPRHPVNMKGSQLWYPIDQKHNRSNILSFPNYISNSPIVPRPMVSMARLMEKEAVVEAAVENKKVVYAK